MEPFSPRLEAAIRPVLPDLAEDIIRAIAEEVPDYRRPMEGPFGRGVRTGVERALERFITGEEEDPAARDVYVGLGAGEYRAGRTLDALLSAYRLGARMSWQRCVAAGREAGVSPDELYDLAGAIFTYIDRISAESVEGYTAEQTAAEAERGRRRRALARMLGRDDVPPGEARDLAVLAGWRWPSDVAALLIQSDEAGRVATSLGPDVLSVAEDGTTIAFVPDPLAPGRIAQLRGVLQGGPPAVVGPAVVPERAHASLHRARAALALVTDGRLPTDELVLADEHLVDLLLHADRALAADLSRAVLAPLDGLRGAGRERLMTTLRAWLDEPGQVTRVAARLHVHPQTVRYRVARLRELLGERLDDPEERFVLALAVRVRH